MPAVAIADADERPLSSCCAVSAPVEVEVEGGRGVLSDEQSGGAPRAQRRVQDAHCTTKWPHNGRQLGMATRCGTHHTLARVGPRLTLKVFFSKQADFLFLIIEGLK